MTGLTLGIATQLAIGFLAGFILGVLHFASLWWNTRLFATGSAGKAYRSTAGDESLWRSRALTLLARLSLVALLFGAVGVPGSPTSRCCGAFRRAAMIHSPLETKALFHVGPVAISDPVIISWVIMVLLVAFAVAVTRRLTLMPSKAQTVLELFVGVIDDQIRDTMQVEPGRVSRTDRDHLRLHTSRQLVIA